MKKLLVIATAIIIILTGCKAAEITGGNIHVQNRQYDKAIEQYKEATKKYPDKAKPYVSLSVPYFLKKNYKEAADILFKALQINKEEAKEGIKEYESFLGLEDYDWQVLYNGSITYMNEDPERAIELVEASEDLSVQEHKSYSYNLHGNLMTILGKNEESEKYYKLSIETYEKYLDPYLSLGKYYMLQRNTEEAILYFENALSVDPTETEVYIWLGQAYLDLEEYEKAIDILGRASSKLKGNASILYNLALSYFKREDYETALTTNEEVIAMEEVDTLIQSKAYNLTGQIYVKQEKYNEAVKILEEAVTKNPNNCEGYHVIAIAYQKLNKNKLSNEYADKWLECLGKE